jgi:hypothetical protein
MQHVHDAGGHALEPRRRLVERPDSQVAEAVCVEVAGGQGAAEPADRPTCPGNAGTVGPPQLIVRSGEPTRRTPKHVHRSTAAGEGGADGQVGVPIGVEVAVREYAAETVVPGATQDTGGAAVPQLVVAGGQALGLGVEDLHRALIASLGRLQLLPGNRDGQVLDTVAVEVRTCEVAGDVPMSANRGVSGRRRDSSTQKRRTPTLRSRWRCAHSTPQSYAAPWVCTIRTCMGCKGGFGPA